MNKLEVRNALKKKKPSFSRQNTGARPTFKGTWRKPKGMHSKKRRNKDGHQNIVSIGYGSIREIKGLNAEGFKRVIVKNVLGLEGLNAKEHVVIISSTVGLKKKMEIIEIAKKAGLKIKSLKDVDAFVKKVKELKEKVKKESLTKKQQREKAKEESLKRKQEEDKKEKESGEKDESEK